MTMPYQNLQELIQLHKQGQALGIYSVCSANPFVLDAALQQALADDSLLLVEATSNQVDQNGGYTGMTPAKFMEYIVARAASNGFPVERLILGGDHLGPNTWQSQPAEFAMEQSKVLIHDFVRAGFSKIHLDTSMACGDDPQGALDPAVIAIRAAELCQVAEESSSAGSNPAPVYVIGTEVPIPGGAQEELESLVPSSARDVVATIDIHRQEFAKRGLEAAWERVIAVVAQPGVEFGSDSVIDYRPEAARGLVKMIESYDSLVFEAHSTDYQQVIALSRLVVDHFAILKVGPQLTFALREALLLLATIEDELSHLLSGQQPSNLKAALVSVMEVEPGYWRNHYSKDPGKRRLEQFYSMSDRIRYYWPVPEVQSAVQSLLENLNSQTIPMTLISQYFPIEYDKIRRGELQNRPLDLIQSRVRNVLSAYASACGVLQPSTAGESK